ncbi:hypothetical protein MPSEU_000875900 [Mayamaea pseudoterrestris]|nr:hypothetical protein MPSEU_000875900 [Mayamaea pseudoterrestris]
MSQHGNSILEVSPMRSRSLPTQFVDAHHHFLDTKQNSFQQRFLASLVGNDVAYLPQDYERDVVTTLKHAGINLVSSVHVECMPDDGYDEACWIELLCQADVNKQHQSNPCTIAAIVASCDLASPNAYDELRKLHSNSKLVRGVRWILDYTGTPYESATHVATTRHAPGMEDYLRGGPNESVLPEFERGFAFLEEFGYTFDLQCAPEQLSSAAELFR